jgi:hypothetical protein
MVQGKTTTPLAYHSSAGGAAVTLSLLQNAASRGARIASGSTPTSVVLAKSESEGCAICSAIKPSTAPTVNAIAISRPTRSSDFIRQVYDERKQSCGIEVSLGRHAPPGGGRKLIGNQLGTGDGGLRDETRI